MSDPRTIFIEEAVQGRNDEIAATNRQLFNRLRVFSMNVMSAPGSGKTEFLARTLTDTFDKFSSGVIVGDIATDNDARRLMRSGVDAVQITTNGYCHLDAEMVARATEAIDLDRIDMLIIENVGNMVCPASFDLGERMRVVLLSVTEGEDKPLKYPTLFKVADVVVVNKLDIADAVGFKRESALENIRTIAPQATIFEVSARTGAGMQSWYDFLCERMELEY